METPFLYKSNEIIDILFQNILKFRINKEFAINKIPFVVDVPNIFSKLSFFKISELINVMLSKVEYKLLSIEPNNCSKIVLIVDIIVVVIVSIFDHTS